MNKSINFTTFNEHYQKLIDELYKVSCNYLNSVLDRAGFEKNIYDYLFRIYYGNDTNFQKLLTGLDKTLREDKLFLHFYECYEKINDKFIYRELNFFISVYKNYEQKVNNYIRLKKIRKINNGLSR